MKVVQFNATGAPQEVCDCVELPDPPAPGGNGVTVEIEAFPINPADLLMIEGRYAALPEFPATPGAEGCGRVTAIGADVTDVKVGDRVIMLDRENFCQVKQTTADQVVKVPDDIDVLQTAMLKVNPPTALMMLRNFVHLAPGDWVIQNAANSAVGDNLIRLAKAADHRTVNIVRRESLIEPLKAIGADVVIVDGDDLAERVAAETGGGAIRLGIDAIGGDMCRRMADCLADGGTMVNYGLLSGEPCVMTSHQLVFRGLTLTGFWLAAALRAMPRPDLETLYGDLAGRIRDGALHAPVEQTYAIEDIKAALAHAGREGRSGKILVAPNGPVN